MAMLKKFAALAGAAAAARAYVKKNPDKVNQMAAKAGQVIDKRTKGKYHGQIDNAVNKVHSVTNKQR